MTYWTKKLLIALTRRGLTISLEAPLGCSWSSAEWLLVSDQMRGSSTSITLEWTETKINWKPSDELKLGKYFSQSLSEENLGDRCPFWSVSLTLRGASHHGFYQTIQTITTHLRTHLSSSEDKIQCSTPKREPQKPRSQLSSWKGLIVARHSLWLGWHNYLITLVQPLILYPHF